VLKTRLCCQECDHELKAEHSHMPLKEFAARNVRNSKTSWEVARCKLCSEVHLENPGSRHTPMGRCARLYYPYVRMNPAAVRRLKRLLNHCCPQCCQQGRSPKLVVGVGIGETRKEHERKRVKVADLSHRLTSHTSLSLVFSHVGKNRTLKSPFATLLCFLFPAPCWVRRTEFFLATQPSGTVGSSF